MSLKDVTQFLQRQQDIKRGDAKDASNMNMKLAIMADAKFKEKKQERQILQSQKFMNQAVESFDVSGWDEDGNWKPSSANPTKSRQTYLAQMESEGMVGDSAALMGQLRQFGVNRIQEDGRILTQKIAQWEADNKGKHGSNDWVPGNNTYDAEKKKFLRSINAQGLYSQFANTAGIQAAVAGTGLTPDDFTAPRAPFGTSVKNFLDNTTNTEKAVATTVSAIGAGVTYKTISSTVNAIKESIATGGELLTNKGKGKELVTKLTAELQALKAKQPTKEALSKISQFEKQLAIITKRGYVDKSAWTVLDKLKQAIPKGLESAVDNTKAITKGKTALEAAQKAVDDIKLPTRTSNALRSLFTVKGFKSLGKNVAGAGIAMAVADKVFGNIAEEGTKTDRALEQGAQTLGITASAFTGGMFTKVKSRLKDKGAAWALKRILTVGGPALATKFALKAGLAGVGTTYTGGIGALAAGAFLASDAIQIYNILMEDE
tara:strand:+ start:427 stop:1893 length:1467 start_codon:yes stop_codon:yes gene_type:complete